MSGDDVSVAPRAAGHGRRHVRLGLSAQASRRAAGARDPRLVVIVLRGGARRPVRRRPRRRSRLRSACTARIALSLTGEHAGASRSTASSPCIRRCRSSRDSTRRASAAVVHATATSYRERSHFDGQDVLESGQPGPGLTQSGWLNRAHRRAAQGRPRRRQGRPRRRAVHGPDHARVGAGARLGAADPGQRPRTTWRRG